MSNPDNSGIANAGDWIILRNWSLSVRKIQKVTPKLLKLGEGSSRYPTQVGRDDERIICVVPTREIAEQLRSAIAGIDGEYGRRLRAANGDRDARVRAAEEARQKAIARVLASALEVKIEGTDNV
jgi:hypothetical protein